MLIAGDHTIGTPELELRHTSEDGQRCSNPRSETTQMKNSGELSVHSAHTPDSNYHNTEFKARPATEAGGEPIATSDLASLVPVFTCFSFYFPVNFVRSPSPFAKLSFRTTAPGPFLLHV